MWLALFNDVSTTGEHHCPSPLSIDEHGTEGDLLRFPFGMIPYTGKCAFYTSLISSIEGSICCCSRLECLRLCCGSLHEVDAFAISHSSVSFLSRAVAGANHRPAYECLMQYSIL